MSAARADLHTFRAPIGRMMRACPSGALRAPEEPPDGRREWGRLGLVLFDQLCALRPSHETGFLEDFRHLGVAEQLVVSRFVHIEDDPHAAVVVRVAEDMRAATAVLLPLLRALGGEHLPEAIEILDLHRA